jgi:AraC-like DNA-binding protein
MNNLQNIGPGFAEVNHVLQDDSGYRLELREMRFGPMKLKWGKYNTPSEKVLSFCPEATTVVSHFRIKDAVAAGRKRSLSEGQFVLYEETPEPYDLRVAATQENWCDFFEASIAEAAFDQLFTGESDFLSRFSKRTPAQTPSFDFTASILPKMYGVINEMYDTSFQGNLKSLFLEAKTIELFLLQIEQLDKRGLAACAALKAQDIEALHSIREYLELNFDKPTSIAVLSRRAGVNSMKLKMGFKQLFNTTVFGYLHTIRMQEAKRLLEGGLFVNEVADRVGYRHPHHFAAAFKRQFGVTPSRLRK